MAREAVKVSLVLASASPRRMALLDQAGLAPSLIIPTDIDESLARNEAPRRHALRLAREKAETAAQLPRVTGLGGEIYILAADTVVALGRRVLPKAEDRDTAHGCLELLSGRSHMVYTGVCVIGPSGRAQTRVVESKVRFKRLTRAETDAYLDTGEWQGKAGAYAIQGRAEVFVRYISGSYSNVVGLPLHEPARLLEGAGFPVHQAWRAGHG